MLPVLIAFGLVSAYAIAVTVIAAALYGQQRMMNKMSVDAKRRERREIRKSERYLEALAARTGVTLHRHPLRDAGENAKPSRKIVTASQLIERQRTSDAGQPRQVPPAIKTHFLRDASSNGAADHQGEL